MQCASEAEEALEASEEDVPSDSSQETDTLNTAGSPTEEPVVTSIVNSSCIHSAFRSSSSLNLPSCDGHCKVKNIPGPTTTLSMGNLAGAPMAASEAMERYRPI